MHPHRLQAVLHSAVQPRSWLAWALPNGVLSATVAQPTKRLGERWEREVGGPFPVALSFPYVVETAPLGSIHIFWCRTPVEPRGKVKINLRLRGDHWRIFRYSRESAAPQISGTSTKGGDDYTTPLKEPVSPKGLFQAVEVRCMTALGRTDMCRSKKIKSCRSGLVSCPRCVVSLRGLEGPILAKKRGGIACLGIERYGVE
jgi:hypothetical protein